MKPFTLDTVLNYRKLQEDIAQQRLFEARKNRDIIKNKLATEQNILDNLINISAQLQRDGINISELILYQERINHVKENVQAIEKKLAEKVELSDKELQHLIHRSRERQIMERLKSHQNTAWRKHLDKKEAAMLDEIAIIRHDAENSI
jgi:flagellar FliJ protein